MKIYKRILIVSILCFVFSACSNPDADKSQEKYPWDIGAANELAIAEDSGITMTLDEESLSASGASFALKNEEAEDAVYGSMYCLQIRINKTWHEIEKYAEWTLEAYILFSGTEETISVNWEELYGVLPAGEYRFVKDFNIADGTIYLACPFVIED